MAAPPSSRASTSGCRRNSLIDPATFTKVPAYSYISMLQLVMEHSRELFRTYIPMFKKLLLNLWDELNKAHTLVSNLEGQLQQHQPPSIASTAPGPR